LYGEEPYETLVRQIQKGQGVLKEKGRKTPQGLLRVRPPSSLVGRGKKQISEEIRKG